MSTSSGDRLSSSLHGQDRTGLPVQVGLQGIYTATREVLAYELLFRSPGMDHANLSSAADHDRATAQVIMATFADFGREQLARGKLLFLNTTKSFFTGELPLPFGPDGMVLELVENIDLTPDVMRGFRSLRARGYALAIDDFDGEPWRMAALPFAQYIKIDIEMTGDRLEAVLDLARAANPSASLIVERIETEVQLEMCRAVGVNLFQGYFLERPRLTTTEALTTSHVTCIQLLTLLGNAESATNDIVDLVRFDPALSLRILRTVSSAAYAPRGGITSVHQALVLLGRDELMSWLTLIIVSGSSNTDRVDEELGARIFARAGACKALVPHDSHAASTVGLLSGIAEALGLSVEKILDGCDVAAPIRAALLEEEGELGAALRAVVGYELEMAQNSRGSSPTVRKGQRHVLPYSEVSWAYLNASVRAHSNVKKFVVRRG